MELFILHRTAPGGTISLNPQRPEFRGREMLASRLGISAAELQPETFGAAGPGALHRQIGRQNFTELVSLAQERDPQLFFEGLLAFGVRQEQVGNVELAGRVYAAVQDAATEGVEGHESLAQRARERLNAILGQGAAGPRAEFLLRRLAQESCEPSALLAMGTAGALFKVARLGMLSRLVAAPSANFFTRGLGARALASVAAFSVEAPAFTLTSHVAGAALGRSQDWSHLGSELASSYLVLGGMRLVGWGAHALSTGTAAIPLRVTLEQSGMLGGILLGHRLEEAFGLRERRGGATTLVDSLALLLQFNVAGNLTRHAFGARFHAWEQGLELQSERLGQNSTAPQGPETPLPPGILFSNLHPALAEIPNPMLLAETLDPARSRNLNIAESRGTGVETHSDSVEGLPEIHPRGDGRTRPVDREVAGAGGIKVVEAQGVYWVIDIDTVNRLRELEVRVGPNVLPPGGSLRVKEGEIISLGERRYVFREALRDSDPGPSSASAQAATISVQRPLNPSFNGGQDGRYTLEFRHRLDALSVGPAQRFASGPRGDATWRVLARRELTAQRVGYQLEFREAEERLQVDLDLDPEQVRLRLRTPAASAKSLAMMFLDWIATQTLVRASRLEVVAADAELLELLRYGLISPSYSRLRLRAADGSESFVEQSWEAMEAQRPKSPGGERWDLSTFPRQILLPPELGLEHRQNAERVFAAWAQERLGQYIPTLTEIEAGAPLPKINRFGVEPSMKALLAELVLPRTRFLEIGYGERFETLQAVERLGGQAWGLELDRVYPPGADREQLRNSELDVLFVNGSPFLFYAQHQVSLPAAIDIVQQFPRAEWVVIQAYNPRTPFEILRHAEILNRIQFEPYYFRVAESRLEPPVFPTDWCQRPDTAHAVLVLRRQP